MEPQVGSEPVGWRLPTGSQINTRFRPITTRSDHSAQERPNTMLQSYQSVQAINIKMPIGWIRPRAPKLPSDEEDESRCQQVYQAFDEAFRNNYVLQDNPDMPHDEFMDDCWAAFERGRDSARGIKDHYIQGVALDRNPPTMRHPTSLTLKRYQLQDVGSAIQIEDVLSSSLLSHGMGMGKTVQAVAQAEHRKEMIRSLGLETPGTVLIVVPAGLVGQWISDLAKNVPFRKVYDYSQQRQIRHKPSQLAEYDYIVCSYDRLNNEYRAATQMARHQELRKAGEKFETLELTDAEVLKSIKPKKIPLRDVLPSGPLYHVFFERVILDESHKGKGNGSVANSLYALQRKYTTLLTATPQQNTYGDWFFQFKMAKFEPFCHDEVWFRQYFVNESTKEEWGPLETGRVRILAILLRGLLLRRTKEKLFEGRHTVPPIRYVDHEPIRVVPETLTGTKYPHHVKLGGKSEYCCQEATKHLWQLWSRSKEQGKKSVFKRQHQELKPVEDEEPMIMLTKIMRARQAAVHPLITMAHPIDPPPGQVSKATIKTLKDRAWKKLMEEGDNYRSSTMDAALDLVEVHLKNPKGGVIVYSQFHKVLDLFEIGLRKRYGIGCLRRTGKSSRSEKQNMIDNFKQWQVDLRDANSTPNPDHMIILMTPTSGGEGLNLPEATRVITLTPAFNPFTDDVSHECLYRTFLSLMWSCF